jgi:hypothetical protein
MKIGIIGAGQILLFQIQEGLNLCSLLLPNLACWQKRTATSLLKSNEDARVRKLYAV